MDEIKRNNNGLEIGETPVYENQSEVSEHAESVNAQKQSNGFVNNENPVIDEIMPVQVDVVKHLDNVLSGNEVGELPVLSDQEKINVLNKLLDDPVGHEAELMDDVLNLNK